MNKKILITAGIIIITVILFGACIQRTKPTPQQLPAELHSPVSICINWTLLEENSFEYEKTFGWPEEWWKQESFEQMEWYLEGPTKRAWTSTDYSLTGARSAKLMNEPRKRACLVAADFEHWNTPKKAMSFYFYLLEGQYETKDAGIWINIDLIDYEKRMWKDAIAGINRFGDIYYGDGYGSTQEERPYSNFNGGFTLDYNKWYKLELYADFDKFGPDEKGMILKLHTDEKIYEWALPLNSWSDQDWKMYEEKGYKLFEFSFGAYYAAISKTNYEKEGYFDDIKCYVCSEK